MRLYRAETTNAEGTEVSVWASRPSDLIVKIKEEPADQDLTWNVDQFEIPFTKQAMIAALDGLIDCVSAQAGSSYHVETYADGRVLEFRPREV